jgi:hypothetical protein
MVISILKKVLHRRAESAWRLLAPGAVRARRRRGATAMEYLAVLSLIVIAALSAINYFGQATKETFQEDSEAIEKAMGNKHHKKPVP